MCAKNLKIVQDFLILTVSDRIWTRKHGWTKALSSQIQISSCSIGLFKLKLSTDLESAYAYSVLFYMNTRPTGASA